jgi:hypothetical protein
VSLKGDVVALSLFPDVTRAGSWLRRPSFTFAYWWQTRRLALADYELVAAPAVEEIPAGIAATVS